MPTVSQIGDCLASSLYRDRREVDAYIRSLREAGLLPRSRGGRGRCGSADAEPIHAVALLLGLLAASRPNDAPAVVRTLLELRCDRLNSHVENVGDFLRPLDDNARDLSLGRLLAIYLGNRGALDAVHLVTIDFTAPWFWCARIFLSGTEPEDGHPVALTATFTTPGVADSLIANGEPVIRTAGTMCRGEALAGLCALFGAAPSDAAKTGAPVNEEVA